MDGVCTFFPMTGEIFFTLPVHGLIILSIKIFTTFSQVILSALAHLLLAPVSRNHNEKLRLAQAIILYKKPFHVMEGSFSLMDSDQHFICSFKNNARTPMGSIGIKYYEPCF
jgi:hypothetical protein